MLQAQAEAAGWVFTHSAAAYSRSQGASTIVIPASVTAEKRLMVASGDYTVITEQGETLTQLLARIAAYENALLTRFAPSESLAGASPTISSTVTSFQSGHGWAASPGSTGSQSDDSSDFLSGTQSRKLTTAGNGGFTASRITAQAARDLTGKMLAFTLKHDHPERLADCRLDVSSDVFTNWSSYDTISPTTNLTSPFYPANEWVKVIAPWGGFTVGGGAGATRSALTAFQVRCKDNAGGVNNMHVQSVEIIPEPANAVISFTFDDGYDGVSRYAYEILSAYGYKGGVAPIINKIGATNFMTLEQLRFLYDHGWEFHPHAWDIAIHNNYDTSTDAQAIEDMFLAKQWLRNNNFGLANNLIIPQGQTLTTTRMDRWQAIGSSARTAYARQRESYPPGHWHNLRTYTLSTANSVSNIEAKIDEAVANKEWLIFQAHNIKETTGAVTDFARADLKTIVDYVHAAGVKVKTIRDVLATGVA